MLHFSKVIANYQYGSFNSRLNPRDRLPPTSPELPTTSPKPESAFVVTMAVSLPFTLAEFDESKQVDFKRTIANVAGVNLADVTIASISSIPANAQRRLFASALRIDMRINAASSNAAGQLGATLSNPASVCMYVCIRACMYVCACACVYILVCIYIRVYTYVYAYLCILRESWCQCLCVLGGVINARVCSCVYVCVCMCVCVYMFLHFFCSECCVHFGTGVLGTNAWAGVYVTQVFF